MKSLLLIGAALLVLPCYAGADTVRPAVGKPLQQAEALMQRGNYNAALQQVNQAATAGHLTPYETLVIAQLRGTAAAGAGDYTQAANAYQTMLAAGTEPPAVQTKLIQAIARFYYQARNYPQAVIWVNRYIAAHGQNQQTRALAAQAYYAQGNYAQAEQAVQREQAAQPGQNLPAAELQLLASAADKSGDQPGYFAALTDLLRTDPSPQYWSAAIATITASPDFPDHLTLDAYRLRFVTGTLTQPADYEDYTERAILAGANAEANTVIDAGFTAGVLNAATDSGHAARLKTLAAKNSIATPQTLSASVRQTKAGPPLDLGIADLNAGDTAKAIKIFQSIANQNPAPLSNPQSALAVLWKIHAEAAAR